MTVVTEHPTRVAILRLVAGLASVSPNRIADEIGVSLGSVAYHVRTLEQRGDLRLVDERRVRGAVEHFYVMTDRGREIAGGLVGIPEPDGRVHVGCASCGHVALIEKPTNGRMPWCTHVGVLTPILVARRPRSIEDATRTVRVVVGVRA